MTLNFDGSELRNRRIELESSLEEASARCAVSAHLIEALEEGDIDAMPGESYAIGFLRSYCRHLGLPPEGYVMGLKEAFEQGPVVGKRKPLFRSKRLPRFQIPQIPFQFSREFQSWVAVCAVLALGWFAYSAVIQPDLDGQHNRAQAASIDTRVSPSVELR